MNCFFPPGVPRTVKQVDFLLLTTVDGIVCYTGVSDDIDTANKTTPLIGSPNNEDGSPRLTLPERLAHFAKKNKTSEVRPPLYGLTYLARPDSVRMDRDEILFEGDRSNPATLFYCMELSGYARFPICNMEFYYQGLVVRIDFRRKEWLPHWRGIKRNLIARLDEFHTAYVNQHAGQAAPP